MCQSPNNQYGTRISTLYRASNPNGVFSPTVLAPQATFTVTNTTVTLSTYDHYFSVCTACYSEPCSDTAGSLMRPCTPQLFESLLGQAVSPGSWFDYVYAGRCYVNGANAAGGIVITRYSHGSLLFDTLLQVLTRKAESGQVMSWTRDRNIAGMLRRYYVFGKSVSSSVWSGVQNFINGLTQGSRLVDAALPRPFEELIVIVGDPLTRADLQSPDCTLCNVVTALEDIKDILRSFTSTEYKAVEIPYGLDLRNYMRDNAPRLWSWYRLFNNVLPSIVPEYRPCPSIGGRLVYTISTPVLYEDPPVDEESVQVQIPENARLMASVYGRLIDPNYGHLIPILYAYAPRYQDVDGVQVISFLNTCSPILYYLFFTTRAVSWVFITFWFARCVSNVLWKAVE